jgi:hypothetical protein
MKVERLFSDIAHNADVEAYDLARGALEDRYAWLEKGIIDVPGGPAEAAMSAAAAAVRSA